MKIHKNAGTRLYAICGLVLLGLFVLLGFNFYTYNKHMVQSQQKDFQRLARSAVYGVGNLLEGEKTALDDFLMQFEMEDSTWIEISDTLRRQAMLSYLNSMPGRRNQILYVDENGAVLDDVRSEQQSVFLELDSWPNMEDFDSRTVVGEAVPAAEHAYLIPIVRPVSTASKCYMIVLINMDEIGRYLDQIIADEGENGYVALKNQSGYLLYHTNPEQIGLHMVEGRKEKYPELNMDYLDDLLKLQMTGEEATYVYDSYWLSRDPVVKRKKISTFTPLVLDHEFWVLTLNLDYRTYTFGIQKYMYLGLGLSFMIFLIVSFLLYRLIKSHEQQQKILLENRHLHELSAAMEEVVQERMQKIHAWKLGQIGIMTEKIAHDLRNFLMPVVGHAEFLLDGDNLTREQRTDAEKIIEYSEKATELVRRLSRYGKNEQIEISYEYFDIGDCLKRWEQDICGVCPEGITIKCGSVPERVQVFGNRTQLQEVLWNLSRNAIDAMEEETGGTLTMDAWVLSRADIENADFLGSGNRDYFVIAVSDTGCGMDAALLAHIFDPFFTTKPDDKGTGLGLGICRDIVLQHGGEITVESEPGKGSTFRVYLPCRRENAG